MSSHYSHNKSGYLSLIVLWLIVSAECFYCIQAVRNSRAGSTSSKKIEVSSDLKKQDSFKDIKNVMHALADTTDSPFPTSLLNRLEAYQTVEESSKAFGRLSDWFVSQHDRLSTLMESYSKEKKKKVLAEITRVLPSRLQTRQALFELCLAAGSTPTEFNEEMPFGKRMSRVKRMMNQAINKQNLMQKSIGSKLGNLASMMPMGGGGGAAKGAGAVAKGGKFAKLAALGTKIKMGGMLAGGKAAAVIGPAVAAAGPFLLAAGAVVGIAAVAAGIAYLIWGSKSAWGDDALEEIMPPLYNSHGLYCGPECEYEWFEFHRQKLNEATKERDTLDNIRRRVNNTELHLQNGMTVEDNVNSMSKMASEFVHDSRTALEKDERLLSEIRRKEMDELQKTIKLSEDSLAHTAKEVDRNMDGVKGLSRALFFQDTAEMHQQASSWINTMSKDYNAETMNVASMQEKDEADVAKQEKDEDKVDKNVIKQSDKVTEELSSGERELKQDRVEYERHSKDTLSGIEKNVESLWKEKSTTINRDKEQAAMDIQQVVEGEASKAQRALDVFQSDIETKAQVYDMQTSADVGKQMSDMNVKSKEAAQDVSLMTRSADRSLQNLEKESMQTTEKSYAGTEKDGAVLEDTNNKFTANSKDDTENLEAGKAALEGGQQNLKAEVYAGNQELMGMTEGANMDLANYLSTVSKKVNDGADDTLMELKHEGIAESDMHAQNVAMASQETSELKNMVTVSHGSLEGMLESQLDSQKNREDLAVSTVESIASELSDDAIAEEQMSKAQYDDVGETFNKRLEEDESEEAREVAEKVNESTEDTNKLEATMHDDKEAYLSESGDVVNLLQNLDHLTEEDRDELLNLSQQLKEVSASDTHMASHANDLIHALATNDTQIVQYLTGQTEASIAGGARALSKLLHDSDQEASMKLVKELSEMTNSNANLKSALYDQKADSEGVNAKLSTKVTGVLKEFGVLGAEGRIDMEHLKNQVDASLHHYAEEAAEKAQKLYVTEEDHWKNSIQPLFVDQVRKQAELAEETLHNNATVGVVSMSDELEKLERRFDKDTSLAATHNSEANNNFALHAADLRGELENMKSEASASGSQSAGVADELLKATDAALAEQELALHDGNETFSESVGEIQKDVEGQIHKIGTVVNNSASQVKQYLDGFVNVIKQAREQGDALNGHTYGKETKKVFSIVQQKNESEAEINHAVDEFSDGQTQQAEKLGLVVDDIHALEANVVNSSKAFRIVVGDKVLLLQGEIAQDFEALRQSLGDDSAALHEMGLIESHETASHIQEVKAEALSEMGDLNDALSQTDGFLAVEGAAAKTMIEGIKNDIGSATSTEENIGTLSNAQIDALLHKALLNSDGLLSSLTDDQKANMNKTADVQHVVAVFVNLLEENMKEDSDSLRDLAQSLENASSINSPSTSSLAELQQKVSIKRGQSNSQKHRSESQFSLVSKGAAMEAEADAQRLALSREMAKIQPIRQEDVSQTVEFKNSLLAQQSRSQKSIADLGAALLAAKAKKEAELKARAAAIQKSMDALRKAIQNSLINAQSSGQEEPTTTNAPMIVSGVFNFADPEPSSTEPVMASGVFNPSEPTIDLNGFITTSPPPTTTQKLQIVSGHIVL